MRIEVEQGMKGQAAGATCIEKEKIRKLLSFVSFTVILIAYFVFLTNLYRPATDTRYRLLGFNGEKNPLDMVYIGGSSTSVYWQPYRAWKDCGFTSYNYCTNSIDVSNTLYYTKEVLQRKKPDLLVIEMRKYAYMNDEYYEPALRNGSDSLSLFSLNRYGLIHDYLQSKDVPEETDRLSLYLDIIKYHSNDEVLGTADYWVCVFNRMHSNDKGWEWDPLWEDVGEPEDFWTQERAELSAIQTDALHELLEYLDEKDVEVLFVVSPFLLGRNEEMVYNRIGDLVESHGYHFLNTNNYVDEMGLDYGEDFYNWQHVNPLGAAKYTRFLERYITANYEMKDHSQDAAYASWDEGYVRFEEEEKVNLQIVRELIEGGEK